MKVSVLGAGNGGQSIAADLAFRGHEVSLYNRTRGRIEPIIKNDGIEVVGDIVQGFAELALVTDDVREAIRGAELVVVAVPSTGHAEMARTCGPFLKKGQIVFLDPGHTLGGLEFSAVIGGIGAGKGVNICETASLTFICRSVGPAKVRITYRARDLLFSAFPSGNTDAMHDVLEPLFPGIIKAKNVIETGLENHNAVLHPPGMLMNAGWVEFTKGGFKFYSEGVTPSVGRVMEELDRERLGIAGKFGFKNRSYAEDAYRSGLSSVESNSIYETIQAEEANRFIKTEDSLQGRFVEEDVGYGLVPWTQIGDIVGVGTPTMKSLIHVANIVNRKNYYKTGRNLEKLGLGNLKGADDLIRFVS